MSFLPTDYEAPKASNNYFKLQEGENRIRILSKPILGWEDWTLEKKPIRFKMSEKPSKSIDPKKPLRHFWSFIVFNAIEGKIQIMNVTQATIRKAIEALSKDGDWGVPYHYDIKIVKSGEGVDTEYHINPVPHKPISQDVIDLFNETPCNLESLFTSEDPFSREQCEKGITPLGSEESQTIVEDKKHPDIIYVNEEQLNKFLDTKNKLKDSDQMEIDVKLKRLNIENYSMIPAATYELILPSMIERLPVSE